MSKCRVCFSSSGERPKCFQTAPRWCWSSCLGGRLHWVVRVWTHSPLPCLGMQPSLYGLALGLRGLPDLFLKSSSWLWPSCSASGAGDCWPHRLVSQKSQHAFPGKVRPARVRRPLNASAPWSYHTSSPHLSGKPFPLWIFTLMHKWSPLGQFLIPPKVIGLNEVRAGQLYSLRGWPSPRLMPQTELILFLVFTGCIYCWPLGCWCLPCPVWGFLCGS